MPYNGPFSYKKLLKSEDFDAIIKNSRYAVVALSKNDRPYVITLSFGYDGKNRCLYFHTSNTGKKLEYIRANPRACVEIIEDWGYVVDQYQHTYRSIVMEGKITIIEDPEQKRYGVGVIIDHLEKNPIAMVNKICTNKDLMDNSVVLKFDIINYEARSGK